VQRLGRGEFPQDSSVQHIILNLPAPPCPAVQSPTVLYLGVITA